MMTQAIQLSYNPKQLGEALMDQYQFSKEEVYKEFEKLGFKTVEEKEWFQEFSFAFVLRHEKIAPENMAFVQALPETLKARFNDVQVGGREGSDLDGLTRRSFASFDGLSDQMLDTVKAVSILGMAAVSLDMGALNCAEKENYVEFVDLVFAAREALAMHRLSVVGIERKTLAARANALKRHQETYMLRNEVVEYWKANISPALSNEKAADVLLRHFPLSHRKLKQYVAAAKRKSTPS